ncbi:hypothetical protein GJAV_G00072530 [Gymnothorax javanicus]|nr:hypothetical protein GJAV_G00072530 [Gymnothorax javanicus]
MECVFARRSPSLFWRQRKNKPKRGSASACSHAGTANSETRQPTRIGSAQWDESLSLSLIFCCQSGLTVSSNIRAEGLSLRWTLRHFHSAFNRQEDLP